MNSLFEQLVNNENLLEKAEKVLKNNLKTNPDEPKVLFNLADLLRKKGDLEQSLFYCKKILETEPENNKALYLNSILSQSASEINFLASVRHTQFYLFENFLSQNELQVIWKNVVEKKEFFKRSKTLLGAEDSRYSFSLDESELPELNNFFPQKILNSYEQVQNKLQLEKHLPDFIEYKLVSYPDGGYFSLHRDNKSTTGNKINRYFSFVYYFYHLPKKFRGGDLLLFDYDKEGETIHTNYTRIKPLNNSIIFFPSNIPHQVTKIKCESSDFNAGRFALTGWIHKNVKN